VCDRTVRVRWRLGFAYVFDLNLNNKTDHVSLRCLLLCSCCFLPTVGGVRLMFTGLPSGGPSVCCPFVNTCCAWRDISSLSGAISMTLATDNRHVSGNCWKGFHVISQRSKSQRDQTDNLNLNVRPSFKLLSYVRRCYLMDGFRWHLRTDIHHVSGHLWIF